MGLNRDILKIAVPSILAGITVPLVGMVDIAVAGHMSGGPGAAAYIGGISVGSMLFDLLYWNFYFLRAGTGGLTAQAYGRQSPRDCARLLVRSVGVALALALVLLCIQVPFTRLGFLVVHSSGEVKDLALKYFFIRVWAAPATISLMSLRGWFIGMQDSISSMITDLIVNGVNIAASIILTLGIGQWEGLGYSGIALGTVIAQYAGLAFALLRIGTKYGHLFDGFSMEDIRVALEGRELKRFFSLNADLFVRSLGLTAIYVGFTSISAGYGDLMLSSSAIMMKLLMLFSYFTDGFAYAAEALCGKYIGARNLRMTRLSVRYVFVWSTGLAVAFVAIYWLLAVPMLRLMTSDASVVQACRQFIPWLMLMPVFGCAAFAWDGVYEGATASRPIRDAMLASTAAFFGIWLLCKHFLIDPSGVLAQGANSISSVPTDALAIHCLLGCYMVHLIVRDIYLTLTYRKHILTKPFNALDPRSSRG